MVSHSVVLELSLEEIPRRAVLNRSNDDARAANHLSGVSFAVDFAQSSPLAQSLIISDFEHGDLMFEAESFDKTHVVRFVAVFRQKATRKSEQDKQSDLFLTR